MRFSVFWASSLCVIPCHCAPRKQLERDKGGLCSVRGFLEQALYCISGEPMKLEIQQNGRNCSTQIHTSPALAN